MPRLGPRSAWRDKANAATRKWNAKHRTKEVQDFYSLVRACKHHHITLDVYHALNEQQNFQCAICGDECLRLHIDHNHDTGRVRGLLCGRCNTGIGLLGDSAELCTVAAYYLA